MVRKKLKQVWGAVAPSIKGMIGLVTSAVRLVAAISFDDKRDAQDEFDQSVYGTIGLYNHNTGKFDDGMQIGGIYGEPYDNQD